MTDTNSPITRKRRRALIILLVIIGAAVVAYWIFSSLIMADCGWSASVKAWIDLDEDGVWDEEEPPLEGVTFYANDRLNKFEKVGGGISDYRGEGFIMVWLPGCPRAKFEIAAEAPDGYRLTTESPVKVTGLGYGSEEKIYEFGFAPLPGSELPREYVPSMHCKQFLDMSPYDLVAASDGIWTAAWDELSRRNPGDLSIESRIRYPENLFGPDAFMLTEHGIWIDGLIEWAYFDGQRWFPYEMNASATFIEVVSSIYESEDGLLWFSAREFFAIYDPNTSEATVYTYPGSKTHVFQQSTMRLVILSYNDDWFAAQVDKDASIDGMFDNQWDVVLDKTIPSSQLREMPFVSSTQYSGTAVGPDGSIWIADAGEVIRYVPSLDEWLTYDHFEAGSSVFTFISGMAIHPDGTIWLSGGRSVLQLTPTSDSSPEATWRKFDARDGFADGTAEQISIDQDGVIWLFGKYSDVVNRCALLETE